MSHPSIKIEAPAPNLIAEYLFAGHRVDVRQRRIFNPGGDALNLSSRAFDTLLALLEQHGEVLSKTTLMNLVWPNVIVEENNLNQAISSLRKALGDTRNENRMILTVPGRGYSFVAPVDYVLQQQSLGPLATDDSPGESSLPAGVVASVSRRIPRPLQLPLAALILLVAGLVLWRQFSLDTSGLNQATLAEATMQASRALPQTRDSIANSIAVLPFANLNPDEENTLFALGLHDEVINQLSKISSLNVIARNSVLALVDQQLPTSSIARVLRVETVLGGTLLFAGDLARVNLQLLNPQSGVTLWTGTYEANTHDISNMIAIQSDIAEHVATALEAEIRQSEKERIESLPTESFKAYRYNLAAKYAHYQQDFAQEWSLARQAMELDPDYVDALFTFSSANTVLVATPLPNMSGREHFELALASAERMIELEPENSAGYSLKAVALGTVPDWNGVEEMRQRLEDMDAPLSERKYIALLLLCLAQFDEAIDIYQANLITEPLNLFGRGFLLAALELSGNPLAADAEYALGDELNPVWWGDQVNLFLAMGRNEPLQDISELVIPPDLKRVLQHYDDKIALRSALQAYVERSNKVSAESVYYAAFAAHLGEPELALSLMRSALQDVWTSLYWLWLPVFDEARKLDSFKQLLRESGVVEYWRLHGWPEVCQPQGSDDFSCDWSARPDAA